MKKGIFYYEMQILMFVIMWKHDLSYTAGPTAKGFKLGRLHIWRDPLWKQHGFPRKVQLVFHKIHILYVLPSLISTSLFLAKKLMLIADTSMRLADYLTDKANKLIECLSQK